MPLNSKGAFHMNPEMGRAAEKAPAIAKPKEAMEPEAAGKGHVELHQGPHPEHGGKFHTIHHPSGEVKAHESLHDAHHAMNEHMGEDGCSGDCSEHGGSMPEGAAEDGEY